MHQSVAGSIPGQAHPQIAGSIPCYGTYGSQPIDVSDINVALSLKIKNKINKKEIELLVCKEPDFLDTAK